MNDTPNPADNVVDLSARFAARIPHLDQDVLKKRPGGPYDGGMEQRIARLETAVDRLDDRARGTELQLATLNERVAHLPSKGFIVSVVLAAQALIAALIAFADVIRAMLTAST